MAKLSKEACDGLRKLRTDLRQAQSTTTRKIGPIQRDLDNDGNEVAGDLVAVVESHIFEDLAAEDATIKEILQVMCEEGAKDRSFRMEKEMGTIR